MEILFTSFFCLKQIKQNNKIIFSTDDWTEFKFLMLELREVQAPTSKNASSSIFNAVFRVP